MVSKTGRKQLTQHGEKIPCHFSRGWTDYKHGETSQEFVNRAETVLYADKRKADPSIEAAVPTQNTPAPAVFS